MVTACKVGICSTVFEFLVFLLYYGNVYAFAHVTSAAFAQAGSGTAQVWSP
jgi:hypothetical protein